MQKDGEGSITEKLTFKQRPEGEKGGSHEDMEGRGLQSERAVRGRALRQDQPWCA